MRSSGPSEAIGLYDSVSYKKKIMDSPFLTSCLPVALCLNFESEGFPDNGVVSGRASGPSILQTGIFLVTQRSVFKLFLLCMKYTTQRTSLTWTRPTSATRVSSNFCRLPNVAYAPKKRQQCQTSFNPVRRTKVPRMEIHQGTRPFGATGSIS